MEELYVLGVSFTRSKKMWTYDKLAFKAKCLLIRKGDVLTANKATSMFFPNDIVSGVVADMGAYHYESLPYCCYASKGRSRVQFNNIRMPLIKKISSLNYEIRESYQGILFNEVCYECPFCDLSKTPEYGWETRMNICMVVPHESRFSHENATKVAHWNTYGKTVAERMAMIADISNVSEVICSNRRFLGNNKQKNCGAPKSSRTVYNYLIRRYDWATRSDSSRYEDYSGSKWLPPSEVVLLDGTTICSNCVYNKEE